MRRLLVMAILFTLTCSAGYFSSKKTNPFENLLSEKITFALTPRSQLVRVLKTGKHLGNTKDPDNALVFKRTIQDLAGKYNLDLRFVDIADSNSIKPSTIIIDIQHIAWDFKFWSATMESEINYLLPDSGCTITSTYKAMGGSKGNNLYHVLKKSNFALLKTLNDEVYAKKD